MIGLLEEHVVFGLRGTPSRPRQFMFLLQLLLQPLLERLAVDFDPGANGLVQKRGRPWSSTAEPSNSSLWPLHNPTTTLSLIIT